MATDSKQKQKIVIAAVLIVVAGALIARQLTARSGQATGRYFMDLTSGKLFAGPLAGLPPIDAPGGAGKGVLAHVFTCGQCTEAEQKVYYLESMSEEARKAVANIDKDPATAGRAMVEGIVVAVPPAAGAEPKWMSRIVPGAVELQTAPTRACGGQPAKKCQP